VSGDATESKLSEFRFDLTSKTHLKESRFDRKSVLLLRKIVTDVANL